MNSEKNNNRAPIQLPPLSLLKEAVPRRSKLLDMLDKFSMLGIELKVTDTTQNLPMTSYVVEPNYEASEQQVQTIAELIDLTLGGNGVRVAKLPGELKIGIEEEKKLYTIRLRELIDSREFRESKGKLPFAVGKDVNGSVIMGDIADLPHMLIGGGSGTGKSVFLHNVIMSLLYRAIPDEVRLMLIDTSGVEFIVYNGLPHLLMPVVTDPMKAAGALGRAVGEMMRRYNLFEANGVKNIEDYNEFVDEYPELNYKKLHYVVIMIDELADLMLAARNEVEESVIKLGQLGRAAGIHMLIAARSPRADVFTELIKANIPSRIAFSVSSSADSRTILDETGAEKLLRWGDMLCKPLGSPEPMRIQGGHVSTREIYNVVDFIKNIGAAPANDNDQEQCDMINMAAQIFIEEQRAATALLQRKLKIGYPQALRIMDELEKTGVISRVDGRDRWEVIMTLDQWQEKKAVLAQGTNDRK